MSFFAKIFSRAPVGAGAEQLPLAVLYATCRDGAPDEFLLRMRETIRKSDALEFFFCNPASFLVCFPGSDEGGLKAEALAEAMRQSAKEYSITGFGAGIKVGDCHFVRGAGEGLNSFLAGDIVNQAMKAALAEAGGSAG